MPECSRPRVYVDEREKASPIPRLLREMGAAVIYTVAGVGDYIVSDRVAFERKTMHDLAASLFDGRLYDQARRLSEHYEVPIILVEGDPAELERVTSRALQVKLALLAISLDYSVRIVWSSGPEESAKIIYSVACREQALKQRPVVIHRKPRLEKLWMQQLYVVQSLPGIGPRLAERLLEKFGSIEAICRASIVELEKVLGYERAVKVYRVIHAPYTSSKAERE
ncbi:ERCC4 domain-containing protein [Hyperthermus butylicus]|uniref:ERCC4-type nuclease n=1 Tax=Hyperthermus butylicus (strain DSM 5456 / JCM 9403 / PLM1-5) TaxID=415426 RepID=A2BL31_HYPBU|nr:ERCC4 domain-containing protein [Hyperthermus butylicus]ABM80692.1 putative ERCC4-type nuclease [Hyperthermus butylicus DSM 5456]